MRGKVLLLRRGTLLLILTALVAAGIFMAVGGPSFVSASAAKRQLPIYSVEREEKVCAISFAEPSDKKELCVKEPAVLWILCAQASAPLSSAPRGSCSEK